MTLNCLLTGEDWYLLVEERKYEKKRYSI